MHYDAAHISYTSQSAHKKPKNPGEVRLIPRRVVAQVPLRAGPTSGAFTEQFSSHWWDGYLPSQNSALRRAKSSLPSSDRLWSMAWARSINDMSTRSDLVRHTLQAVSLTYSGNCTRNQVLVREGLKHYGIALCQLNAVLVDPGHAADSVAILPTCILLSHLEVRLNYSLIASALLTSHGLSCSTSFRTRESRRVP